MTDNAERRDEVVAGALRGLPIPDHGPTFWADLDRALAEDTSSPVPPELPAVVRLDTGELPAVTSLADERQRRSRRAPWLAAAAAVIVLAAAVGIVTLGGDDGGDNDLAGENGTETTSAPTTAGVFAEDGSAGSTTAPTPVDDSTTIAAAGAESPDGAVRTWLEALAEGDEEAAAALLGPRSINYIGTFSTPEDFMVDSEEGYGAWTAAEDLEIAAIDLGPAPALGPESRLAVVTIAGTRPGEGGSEVRFDALPVVNDGTGWTIEHLAFDPARDDNSPVFTVPVATPDGLTMGVRDDINVFVPAEGTVYFQLDGGEVSSKTTTLLGRDPEPFALYNPPGDGIAAGPHQLVVVAVGNDGTISYFGGIFTATG